MSQDPAQRPLGDGSAATRSAFAMAAAQAGACSAGLVRRMADLDVLDGLLHAPSGEAPAEGVVVDQAEDLRRRLGDQHRQAWAALRSVHVAGWLLDERATAGFSARGRDDSGTDEFAHAIRSATDTAIVLAQAVNAARQALGPVAGGLATDPNLLVDAVLAVARCTCWVRQASAAASDLRAHLSQAGGAA